MKTLEQLRASRDVYLENMDQMARDGKSIEAAAYVSLIGQLDAEIKPLAYLESISKWKEERQEYSEGGPPPTRPKY